MQDATADALAPLPARYAELFARVLRAAESDDRIRAVWLSGSIGRGVADAGSDLDVAIAVAPGEFGSAAGGPEGPEAVGPDGGRLAQLVAEFLRQMAIFPAAVVARQDWLLGVVGVQGAQLLLYELFVETNQPLPPMGVKQWSAKLTPRQRQICASLPAPTARRNSVLEAMRSTAATFRREAEAVCADHEVPWPTDFDQAVRGYWQAELGWTGSADSG